MDNRPANASGRPTEASSDEGSSLDDRLEAMGRLERRWLLLELSTAGPDDGPRDDHPRNDHRRDDESRVGEPRVDLGELASEPGEMDPLVTMRHLHLPVLEDRGFVRWDRDTHRVTRGPRFDELEPFLRLFREVRRDLDSRD